ncbi:hypothetical protein [Pseudomonas citrulli]|uniref:Lipoprotein n=1 Tax=Pseudomonas citrulli TaxID=3064347 RepID=A0ABT9C0D3_9PSED|nr:hypothetical protein [Pseudomonas sp. K18]MDO7896652.1 hypothetical protein [Pseudomonas sp. K18]
MKTILRMTSLGLNLAITAGCIYKPPDTFTFTADLPPDFAYQAIAVYVPAKGQTCTVPGGRNTEVGYNLHWRKHYQADSKIALYRTVSGCRLVIHRIKLEINSAYGDDWGDISGDAAIVAIRDELEPQYKGIFSEAGESVFYGQCQWLFRTAGPKRRIVKILDCKETNAQGELQIGRPFSAYTLDQLPGKTLRMTITLAEEERPYMRDTWVKVPNGWKRCLGKSFEDPYAFCLGNHRDFSGFQMPDGQKCTLYPGCKE